MKRVTNIFCMSIIITGFLVFMWTPQGRDQLPSLIFGTSVGCLIGWLLTKED